jgi:hypothetical protein
MTLDDISTETLIKMRERFHNGRAHFRPVAASLAWMQECQREIIEAVELELRRRLN